MKIPFGADILKIQKEVLERQERRDEERRAKGHISFFEMTREQKVESIRNNPKAMKLLEEQGLTIDENGNLVEKEQKEKNKSL